MKALRLAIATGLLMVVLGITPAAQANDCTNPKQCGGCHVNWEFSVQDPHPIVCYI
jgi:hypothetical protein